MAKKKPLYYPPKRLSPFMPNRNREIRDLYNKLRKSYKYSLVLDFFAQNYCIQEGQLMTVLRRTDKEPVDLKKASVAYQIAIKDDFNLLHYVQVAA